jgi:hypothetical protein
MNDLTNEILQKLDNFLDSVLNKVNASIDMKYYNDVIMNTTTQSEGTMNKNIIDYNNDSYINEIHDEEDDAKEEGEEVEGEDEKEKEKEKEKVKEKKEEKVIKKETSKK